MRFARRLGFVVVVGVVARVIYIAVVLRHTPPGLDATWYYLEAGVLRHDHAYADPNVFALGRAPTAAFPPLYPVLLAIVQSLFGDELLPSQLAGVATGGATIALTGWIGRKAGGDRVGLVAASLAACSPMLLAVDGSMMSETLFVPLVLATVLAAMHARVSRSLRPWMVVGLFGGLAVLTRADGVIVIACVALPALVGAEVPARAKWIRLGVVVAIASVVVMPWVVRNAIRLDTPTIATVSSATALAGANCDETYAGSATGAWEHACIDEELRASLGEVEWTDRIRGDAVDYARAHPSRLPVVAAARVSRVWGIWPPGDAIARESEESRSRRWQWLVTGTAPLVLACGIVGLAQSRRRVSIGPLVGLLVATTLSGLFAYGNTRFRAVSEPALLIGTAVVLVELGATLRVRARPRSSEVRSV